MIEGPHGFATYRQAVEASRFIVRAVTCETSNGLSSKTRHARKGVR